MCPRLARVSTKAKAVPPFVSESRAIGAPSLSKIGDGGDHRPGPLPIGAGVVEGPLHPAMHRGGERHVARDEERPRDESPVMRRRLKVTHLVGQMADGERRRLTVPQFTFRALPAQ
jgi:hypothetical protein